MYNFNDIAWYCVVTLNDCCLDLHLTSLRTHYPDIKIYVVDNNDGKYDIREIAKKHSAEVFFHEGIQPLTVNQDRYSRMLFEKHKILCFSSDDIEILEGGFIELALDKVNNGSELVSFATDADPVAYMYTERFFNEVGFNLELKGKEHTDKYLIKRCREKYGKLDSVGEYWRDQKPNWRSRYVLNPGVGSNGKINVGDRLSELNIDNGVKSNKKYL